VRDFWISDSMRNRCNHLETMPSVMSYVYCPFSYRKKQTLGTAKLSDAFPLPLVVAFNTFVGALDVVISNPCVFFSASVT
jgi:hypothetical protein